MKRLRRIWHFFAGHPVAVTWPILGAAEMECEGCGKRGARL